MWTFSSEIYPQRLYLEAEEKLEDFTSHIK
jgi:hypothetical protein